MSKISDKFNSAVDQSGRIAGRRREDYYDSENRFLRMLGGGQEALNTYAGSAFNSLLPQYQQAMQGTNESLQRRGIANGESAAYQVGNTQNRFADALSNAIAGQSMNLYGQQLGGYGQMYGQSGQLMDAGEDRYLAGLGTAYEFDEAAKARAKARKSSMLGGIAKLGGTAIGAGLGFMVGGPGGAMMGAKLGGAAGGSFGGG